MKALSPAPLNLGKVAFQRSDFAGAAALFEEGFSCASSIYCAEHLVLLLINQAELFYQRGDRFAALQRLQRARAITQADYPLGLSPIYACLGEVMAAMGDDDQAGDCLERASHRREPSNARGSFAMPKTGLANFISSELRCSAPKPPSRNRRALKQLEYAGCAGRSAPWMSQSRF